MLRITPKKKIMAALVGGFCLALIAGYQYSEPPPVAAARAGAPTGVATTVHVIKAAQPQATWVELDGRVQLSGGVRVVSAETAGRVLAPVAEVGNQVESGAILARIDGRDTQDALAQTAADLAKAESAVALALRTYEDQVRLAAKDYVSQQSVREAEASMLAAQAQVASIQALQAQRQREVDGMAVRATHQGVVLSRKVSEGQYVTKGTPLFDLQPDGAMEILVQVPAGLAEDLTTQTELTVKRAAGAPVSAEILRIAPHVSADLSRGVYVKAPAGVLAGQFIKVLVPAKAGNVGHLVPASALVLEGSAAFVMKVVQSKAQKLPVQLRQSSEAGVWLEGPVEGDALAVSAAALLKDGQQVTVVGAAQ